MKKWIIIGLLVWYCIGLGVLIKMELEAYYFCLSPTGVCPTISSQERILKAIQNPIFWMMAPFWPLSINSVQ